MDLRQAPEFDVMSQGWKEGAGVMCWEWSAGGDRKPCRFSNTEFARFAPKP